MTVEDRLHTSDDPGFRDAVTFAFGDPKARLYGLVRLSRGGDGSDGLAVVYSDGEPVAASAGGAPADDAARWEDVTASGVRVSTVTPLETWTVAREGSDGALDLRFEACSAPAAFDAESPVARAGGMEGYDQLCRVTGSVRHDGRTSRVRCLGQRGQLWGNPDWGRIELARSLSAWLGEDRALTLTAVRAARSKSHLDEAIGGFVFEDGEPVEIAEPRLSTTYDGERRHRRAGLELWMTEEGEVARRVAGEALCGMTLDLGSQRLDSAFFAWRMEGREGVGRYDILRRAERAGAGKRR